MRIAIESHSESVARSLRAMLELAGHTPCPAEAAELVIRDDIHPLHSSAATVIPQLTLGGDRVDALPCPLRIDVLLQTIARASAPALPLAGGWSLDMAARLLRHAVRTPQALTEKECALLASLASAQAPMPREQLLCRVWGVAAQVETHTLETHIYRLRTKLNGLSPSPGDLVTEGGSYRLVFA